MLRAGARLSMVLFRDVSGDDQNAVGSFLVPAAVTPSAARPALRPAGTALASDLLILARFLRGADRLFLLCLCGFGIGAMARQSLLVPWVAATSADGNVLALVAEGILQFL